MDKAALHKCKKFIIANSYGQTRMEYNNCICYKVQEVYISTIPLSRKL